jgi:hypothetical protein
VSNGRREASRHFERSFPVSGSGGFSLERCGWNYGSLGAFLDEGAGKILKYASFENGCQLSNARLHEVSMARRRFSSRSQPRMTLEFTNDNSYLSTSAEGFRDEGRSSQCMSD